MFNNDTGGGRFFIPFLPIDNTEDVKQAHDSYDFYVGEEYLGKCELMTASEEADDVLSFLEKQGLRVEGKLDGDHFIVQPIHAKENEKVKRAVEVFLHNR
ncbi:hypothetical protein P4637_01320 [Halalkalibacterium halodurans]|jgi:hypothetical protein|uniref:BH1780 protein n=2 Tax=Halalkalibacterium halodurans TaxID=86665 RepID=Q9KBZ4_HALH5|nr:hypothetical protein [Halalkalibacterium halodurans]MDY7222340.1 hypothetical protein [Halalkalibacterium halodurans]MDY7241561.1 hypothetical protein [Halalkalibacterium halodurans]MED3647711.1 hypothetical protein [Halalkalibacterium halodurans]MED4082353.1 hypothetical protein [Halalkalibacterium halodurans]MED4083496.1 hypothetical protein [Halalkalibacterium halodurans]